MMKKQLAAMLATVMFVTSALATVPPAQAATPENPETISTPPGGVVDRQVDAKSGTISFSMPLGSLTGHSGPNFSLNLSYNSRHVPATADLHNRTSKASLVGLGWTINENSRIERHHQQTGTTADDSFTLTLNDSRYKLYLLAKAQPYSEDNSYVYDSYRSAQFNQFILKHIRPANQTLSMAKPDYWMLETGDGQITFFGDLAAGERRPVSSQSPPNITAMCDILTPQKPGGGRLFPAGASECVLSNTETTIFWGNWTGPSVNPVGQNTLPTAWNISRIQDSLGNQTRLQYVQHVQAVGAEAFAQNADMVFTKRSYLAQVWQQDRKGHKGANELHLYYCAMGGAPLGIVETSQKQSSPKADHCSNTSTDTLFETVDPTQINLEPDGLQERFTALYLKSVNSVLNAQPMHRAVLDYGQYIDIKGENETVKRVLTELHQELYDTEVETFIATAPATRFTYSPAKGRSDTTAPPSGVINTITYPNGTTKTFHFKNVSTGVKADMKLQVTKGKNKIIVSAKGYHLVLDAGRLLLVEWTPVGWQSTVLEEHFIPDDLALVYYNPGKHIIATDSFFAYAKFVNPKEGSTDKSTLQFYMRSQGLIEEDNRASSFRKAGAFDLQPLFSGSQPFTSEYYGGLLLHAGNGFVLAYVLEEDSAYIFHAPRQQDLAQSSTHSDFIQDPTPISFARDVPITQGLHSTPIIAASPRYNHFAIVNYAWKFAGSGSEFADIQSFVTRLFSIDPITQKVQPMDVAPPAPVDTFIRPLGVKEGNEVLYLRPRYVRWQELVPLAPSRPYPPAQQSSIRMANIKFGFFNNYLLPNGVAVSLPYMGDWGSRWGSQVLMQHFTGSNTTAPAMDIEPRKGMQTHAVQPPTTPYNYYQNHFNIVGPYVYNTKQVDHGIYYVENMFFIGSAGVVSNNALHAGMRLVNQVYYNDRNPYETFDTMWTTSCWRGASVYDGNVWKTSYVQDYVAEYVTGNVRCETAFPLAQTPLHLALQASNKTGVTNSYYLLDPVKLHMQSSTQTPMRPDTRMSTIDDKVSPANWSESFGPYKNLGVNPAHDSGYPPQARNAQGAGIAAKIDQAIGYVFMALNVLELFNPETTAQAVVGLVLTAYSEIDQYVIQPELLRMVGGEADPTSTSTTGRFIQDGESTWQISLNGTLSAVPFAVLPETALKQNYVFSTQTTRSPSQQGFSVLNYLRRGNKGYEAAGSHVVFNKNGQYLQEGAQFLFQESVISSGLPTFDHNTPLGLTTDTGKEAMTADIRFLHSQMVFADRFITHDGFDTWSERGLQTPSIAQADTLNFYKVYRGGAGYDQFQGEIVVPVVDSVTTTTVEGISTETTYAYDVATLDKSGVPQFGRVFVSPGGLGGIMHYFLNQKTSETDLGANIALADGGVFKGLTQVKVCPLTEQTCTNTQDPRALAVLDGYAYRMAVMDASRTVLRQSWRKPAVLFSNEENQPTRTRMVVEQQLAEHRGVAQIQSHTYNALSQPVSTSSTMQLVDPVGKTTQDLARTSTVTYAWENNPKIQEAHQLTLVSEHISTEQKVGQSDSYRHVQQSDFAAPTALPTTFLSTAHYRSKKLNPVGMAPGADWLLTHKVLQRSPSRLLPVQVQDMLGNVQHIILSTSSVSSSVPGFLTERPVAVFPLLPAGTSAGFTSFEFYEDASLWQLSGGAYADQFAAGNQGYGGDGAVSAEPATFSTTDESYFMGAWLAPAQGQVCSVSVGTATSTTPTGDGRTFHYVEAAGAASKPPRATCAHGGVMDNIAFGPVNSQFTAMTYDNLGRLTSHIDGSGTFSRVIIGADNRHHGMISFDHHYPLQTSTDDRQTLTGQIGRLGTAGFASFGGFNRPLTTGATLPYHSHIAIMSKALHRDQYIKNPMVNQGYALGGGSFAFKAHVNNDTGAKLAFQDFTLDVQSLPGSMESRVTLAQNSRVLGDVTLPQDAVREIIGVVAAGKVRILANGKMVIEQNIDTPSTASACLGSGPVLCVKEDTVQHLFIIQNITEILAGYGGHRGVMQTQRWRIVEGQNTTVATARISDGAGRAITSTSPVAYLDGSLNFRDGLVTGVNWATGALSGDVATRADATGADQEFASVFVRRESSPIGVPERRSLLPGAAFQVDGPLSGLSQRQTPADIDLGENGFGLRKNSFMAVDSVRPIATPPTHVTGYSFATAQGAKVAGQMVFGDLTLTHGMSADAYLQGSEGFIAHQSQHYQPNAFADAPQHEAFVDETRVGGLELRHSVHISQDSGRTEIFKDDFGRPRIVLRGGVESGSDTHISYMNYDRLSRLVETGALRVAGSSADYLQWANDPGFPSAAQSCPTDRYFYDVDHTGSSLDRRGKLASHIRNQALLSGDLTEGCGSAKVGWVRQITNVEKTPVPVLTTAHSSKPVTGTAFKDATVKLEAGETFRVTANLLGADGYMQALVYPDRDQRDPEAYDNQFKVFIIRDAHGRFKGLCSTAACGSDSMAYAQDMRYDVRGRIVGYQSANGAITHSHTFDTQQRLLQRAVTTEDTALIEEVMGYGRHITRLETLERGGAVVPESNSLHFSYIGDRLQSVTDRSGGQSYSFDHNSNLAEQVRTVDGAATSDKVTLYPGTNRPQTIQRTQDDKTTVLRQLSFDGRGQMTEVVTADKTIAYTRDRRGKIVQAATPDMRVEKQYNTSGQLTGKTVVGKSRTQSTSYWGHTSSGMALVTESGDSTEYAIGLPGSGHTLAVLRHREHQKDLAYYVHDFRGSVRGVVDAKGEKVLSTVDYSLFGAPRLLTGEMPSATFLGKRYEAETGTLHYTPREYDPAVGMFLGPDPAKASYAPYFYTADPANRTDRSGLGWDPSARMWVEGYEHRRTHLPQQANLHHIRDATGLSGHAVSPLAQDIDRISRHTMNTQVSRAMVISENHGRTRAQSTYIRARGDDIALHAWQAAHAQPGVLGPEPYATLSRVYDVLRDQLVDSADHVFTHHNVTAQWEQIDMYINARDSISWIFDDRLNNNPAIKDLMAESLASNDRGANSSANFTQMYVAEGKIASEHMANVWARATILDHVKRSGLAYPNIEFKRSMSKHEFLIVGRTLGMLQEPHTWNPDALIVDPTFNVILRAQDVYRESFPVVREAMTRLLNWTYATQRWANPRRRLVKMIRKVYHDANRYAPFAALGDY